jgi:hypothetical protein
VGIHADSVRVRGFAGLPDGSQWLIDEVAIGDGGRTDDPAAFEAAGRRLAERMLAAGAGNLLREAEAMAAR